MSSEHQENEDQTAEDTPQNPESPAPELPTEVSSRETSQRMDAPPESQSTTFERTELSLGPLPPPSMLQGYNEVVPGAANRIIQMAESEAGNRRQYREKRLEIANGASKRAQWFAFIISMTVIIGSLILIGMDKKAGGISAIIATLVSLVATFLGGQYFQEKSAGKRPPVSTGDTAE